MHVVITLAGHSRRFQSAGYTIPKFLIEIDGMPMIQHVVNMFDAKDDFYFVINETQLQEFPHLAPLLASLAKKTHLTVIAPHEQGPVVSAMQIREIPANAEVIISYCDFYVAWDYKQFKRQIYGYDGAVPAFRGFHPASFGHTYYAYMRVNAAQEMLELREKNSFTPTRHEEFASAGIYYFRSWKLFMHYTHLLIQTGFDSLKEGYVSLLFNPMVHDNLKVKVTEVDKFICWGTPEDLAQYQFWSNYFHSLPHVTIDYADNEHQINVIPMAGLGSRFRKYGYRAGKPLITVRQRPMVVAACESFPSASHWIFLPRANDLAKHPLENALKSFAPHCTIVPVTYDTSGQAATCLLAEPYIPPARPLFIASCDYETRFNTATWQNLLQDESIDAVIWTYRMRDAMAKDPNAFAYCVTADDGYTITEIVEKRTISNTPHTDPLVVGSFWFRRAADFLWAAHKAIDEDITVNGEHYVANSMNLLLQQGKKIVIFDIEQWISLGDPFELNLFHYWEDYFTKNHKNRSGSYLRKKIHETIP
jgi:NDP-sugar pyrophosphorylase family protein